MLQGFNSQLTMLDTRASSGMGEGQGARDSGGEFGQSGPLDSGNGNGNGSGSFNKELDDEIPF